MPDDAIPDLWPQQLAAEALRTPVSILRSQATALGRRTKNVLEGDITTVRGEQGQFVHSFFIVAPALDDYRYRLFSISHDVNLYPISVIERNAFHVNPILPNEAALIDWLRTVFASEETQRVISSLLAQSSETALSA